MVPDKTMTGTSVTLLLIGCWFGAVFGAKSWEVPTADLRGHINNDLDQDWNTFLKTYNKTYSTSEELTRRFLWEDTLKYIRSHNLRYDRGEVTYYLGENQFADMECGEIICSWCPADGTAFVVSRFYKGGIYNEPECNKYYPTHAMLAVGYGTYRGRDYWTVKNSWGKYWGQRGYVFIKRNVGDPCGISMYASYPVI